MNNFYIAFAVYLNLIFVAAKLWGRVDWSWLWIMTPLIVMTVIGTIASLGQAAKKKQLRDNIVYNLNSLKDLVESARQARTADEPVRSQRSGDRH